MKNDTIIIGQSELAVERFRDDIYSEDLRFLLATHEEYYSTSLHRHVHF
jgi:hypothetical protein